MSGLPGRPWIIVKKINYIMIIKKKGTRKGTLFFIGNINDSLIYQLRY